MPSFVHYTENTGSKAAVVVRLAGTQVHSFGPEKVAYERGQLRDTFVKYRSRRFQRKYLRTYKAVGRVHGNIHPERHLLEYRLDNSAAAGDDGGVAIVQGIPGSLEEGRKEEHTRHCERTMTIRSVSPKRNYKQWTR